MLLSIQLNPKGGIQLLQLYDATKRRFTKLMKTKNDVCARFVNPNILFTLNNFNCTNCFNLF